MYLQRTGNLSAVLPIYNGIYMGARTVARSVHGRLACIKAQH